MLPCLPRYDYSYRYSGFPASKGMIAPGKRWVILTGPLARDHDIVQKEVGFDQHKNAGFFGLCGTPKFL